MTDQPEVKQKPKRPLAITVVCISGLGWELYLLSKLTPYFLDTISYDLRYGISILSAIATIACFIGLWKMKKWSMYGSFGIALLHTISKTLIFWWNPQLLIIPGIIIIATLKQWKKME